MDTGGLLNDFKYLISTALHRQGIPIAEQQSPRFYQKPTLLHDYRKKQSLLPSAPQSQKGHFDELHQ